MQEPLFTIVFNSLFGIMQIVLSFQSKSSWALAFSIVGSVLVVAGTVRTGYYHDAGAKYFLSIPGVTLVGVSIVLQATRLVARIRAQKHLKEVS